MSDSDYPSKINAMLKNGQDPKDFMIEVCRPGCKQYEDKLRRCEHALKTMVHVDPEMTWQACTHYVIGSPASMDAQEKQVMVQVQPKIHTRLVGNQKGFIS